VIVAKRVASSFSRRLIEPASRKNAPRAENEAQREAYAKLAAAFGK
jgi:hypothetical protein